MNIDQKEEQSGEMTAMKKILILEGFDFQLAQQFEVKLPYDYQNRELDLGHAVHKIIIEGFGDLKEAQVFYYNPLNNFYVFGGRFPFKEPLLIGEEYINLPSISVKLRKITSQYQEENIENLENEKKKRSSQRTIRETLQKVTEWRQTNQKNSKITLEQAAKMVGIPKNTLDDYYFQIKIASQYGFDFKNNLEKKIGVLRKFVKENHLKKKETNQQFSLMDLSWMKSHDSENEEQE